MKFWYKSWAITLKISCDDLKLDLVNINAHIKCGENLSICSQNSEQKQNSGVN